MRCVSRTIKYSFVCENNGSPRYRKTAMTISEDLIREELKKVVDPELFVNIVDLGLIYLVEIEPTTEDKHKIKIEMTMTSPMCPAGPQLVANCKQVLGQLPNVENVEV